MIFHILDYRDWYNPALTRVMLGTADTMELLQILQRGFHSCLESAQSPVVPGPLWLEESRERARVNRKTIL